jgi:ferredoxin-type protein NapH
MSSFFSSIRVKYLRHVVQVQVLILFLYGVSRPSSFASFLWGLDPVQGISAAVLGYRIAGAAFYSLLVMVFASVLLGRVFCGWICPVGLIQDLFSFMRLSLQVPRWSYLIKYGLLAGGFFSLLLSGWSFLQWFTPLPLLTRGLIPIFRPGLILQAGTAIFVLSILFTVVSDKRAWCRYICPTGAMLSVFSSFKQVEVGVDDGKCIQCLRCEEECVMGVREIGAGNRFSGGNECIACLSCHDACPANAIGIGRVKTARAMNHKGV